MNSRNSLRFRACRLCVLCALLYDARANIFQFISRERYDSSHCTLCRLSLQTAVNFMVTTPTATADTRATRQQKHVSSARVVCNNPK